MINFRNQQKSTLGLDISEVSLKLLQLANSGSHNHQVAGYTEITVQKDALSGDRIRDPETLVQAIKRAISSPKFGRITTSYVVASIPETKSFVRVIQMPKMAEEEMDEAVAWEAEAYIPLPVGQVYLDWVILDPNRPDGKMTVLITASPKEYVDDLVNVIKAAGLAPLALEVESQATARSLISRTDETVLIMDISTVRTSLIIYGQGALQFTSSLPVAGVVFTDSISKTLGIDFDQAEKLKIQYGLEAVGEGSKIKKALLPVLNTLLSEIKNTIRFYEEHSGETSKIHRLFLTGGSSKLKHLPSFLFDRLTRQDENDHALRSIPGLKVELGNPWVNVLKKGEVPPLSREESLSFATVIGLALREIE